MIACRRHVTAATTAVARREQHPVVDDIVVTDTWRDRLEAIVGGRRESLVLAGFVAVLVLGALALWTRGTPASIAPPATSPPEAAPSSPVVALLYVHVAGAVQRPGLYELPDGARIADAIAAAGGALPRADVDALNLAEVLVDGQKVEVPRKGAPADPVPTQPSSPVAGGSSVVDLNTADQIALEDIPGIGPVKAAAIIAYREESGGFSSIEQLLEVSGIGPATLESIRPYVTV